MSDDKPNVIVVLCDQLRTFELGYYGNSVINTPNIDRLAENGVRFDLAVTNNPVCTPARSCLMTGQHSRTCTGEVGNVADDPPCSERMRLRDTTLPEAFKSRGYDTALIGKWHVHPFPRLVGFDYAWFPLNIHRYRGQRYWENEQLGPPLEGFGPELEIEKVSEYVAEHKDSPFFLFYNISLPHEPIGPAEMPERYITMYRPDDMPLRPNVWQDGKIAHSDHWFKVYQIWDYFWRLAGGDPWGSCEGYPTEKGELPSDALPEGFDLRHLYALYYGATTWVDDQVGRLMHILEQNGIAENTIVVFSSDHGDNLGSHHLFNKDCLYEESIRIPMIFHAPERFRPRVNARQVAQIIDVMPTILDMCGIETPESVQGRSLMPLITGEQQALPGQNFAFIETDPFFFETPCIGIRTPTHLYGLRLDDDWRGVRDEWGFFDLTADPLQNNNLAESGEQPAVAQELRNDLEELNACVPWLDV